MDIIPPKNIYTKEHWASIFGATLAAGVLWASHFVIEYGICILNDIDIRWVNISYLGCLIGSILSLLISTRLKHHRAYILYTVTPNEPCKFGSVTIGSPQNIDSKIIDL